MVPPGVQIRGGPNPLGHLSYGPPGLQFGAAQAITLVALSTFVHSYAIHFCMSLSESTWGWTTNPRQNHHFVLRHSHWKSTVFNTSYARDRQRANVPNKQNKKRGRICNNSQSKQRSRCQLAPFSTMYVQQACKIDFCFEIWHPCEYFLSANDAGLSSAAWKTNRSLENTLSGYNSTETVSWLSRNLRKALTLFRWSCQLYIHEFQCRSTKYFNFKCRFENVTRESPHWRQATIRTFRFNDISWNIILKTTLCNSGYRWWHTMEW